jgi:MoxR-like ATPase
LPEWRPDEVSRARFLQTAKGTVELVNTALYLRRPLLVTGKPGVGKSTLALALAYELNLGPVLRWPITSHSTIKEALYSYDALGRLHEVNVEASEMTADLGRYLSLGPLGTALLPRSRPRVLLIDEIDKSDIDLPNDLLNLLEDGEYQIPELTRIAADRPEVKVATADRDGRATIHEGRVRCSAFPVIVLTSNREREFPPAFLRRCVPLEIRPPDRAQLAAIVEARLGADMRATADDIITAFLNRQTHHELATDQLLNAIYLTFYAAREHGQDRSDLIKRLLWALRPAAAD